MSDTKLKGKVARVVDCLSGGGVHIIAYKEDGKTPSKIINYTNAFWIAPLNDEGYHYHVGVPKPLSDHEQISFTQPVKDLLSILADRKSQTWYDDGTTD